MFSPRILGRVPAPPARLAVFAAVLLLFGAAPCQVLRCGHAEDLKSEVLLHVEQPEKWEDGALIGVVA